ncbi:MAG: winged helix-turn-helix transcriptional regulator [Planctomycetes bacterium]|nr:winged helix-turn-helix transcriptional regulator [Planctomycetota bacterium]
MLANCFADPAAVGEMADLMRLLSDPTRIRVLGLLQPGEMNVSALCRELTLAQPTVSHHLGLMRTAGLLSTRRDGKQVYYSLNPEHLSAQEPESFHVNVGHVNMSVGFSGLNGNGLIASGVA